MPSASVATSASASASASASSTPTSSPSVEPSLDPSPTAAAGGSFEVAWEEVPGFEHPGRSDEGGEGGVAVHGISLIEGRWFATGSAGRDAAIWTSSDGTAWTRATIATIRAADEAMRAEGVVVIGDVLVAVGSWGAVPSDQFAWVTWRSTDSGSSWEEDRNSALPFGLRAITAGGPGAVGVVWTYAGTLPFDSVIVTTDDGVEWSEHRPSSMRVAEVKAVAAFGDRLVAVGRQLDEGTPAAWISDDDGATWGMVLLASATEDGMGVASDLVVSDTEIVAVGESGAAASPIPVAWRSTDGETWTVAPMGEAGSAIGVTAVDRGFVAVGGATSNEPAPPMVWTSPDASSWTETSPPTETSLWIEAVAGSVGEVNAGALCADDPCATTLWHGVITEPD
ncbi:MAG TPA: sialidase family protein [Candidatus Limnocylindria bacterium]